MTSAEVRDILGAPVRVRGTDVRNRVWMSPMSVYYAKDNEVTEAEIEHYGRRARGGAGMVITESVAVSEAGRQLSRQTMASDVRYLSGLSRIAEAIHEGGSLAVVQLVHAGRYAGPWEEYGARRRLAPSAVEFPLTPVSRVTPDEVTPDEIAEVIDEFARAAALVARAGFDGVEIHGAQGFLLAQFLSPRMNRREDEWGGSFENRARLSLEVVKAVRATVPDEFIIGFHLLAEELLEGGFSAAEAVDLARLLPASGVDFIIPAVATFEDLHVHRSLMASPRFQMSHIEAIASAVDIPVIANGTLGDPDDCALILRDGGAAAISLARPLLVDPDWPNKALAGLAVDIHTCPCDPPQCIRTQMSGVTCSAWPAEVQARGYLGYND